MSTLHSQCEGSRRSSRAANLNPVHLGGDYGLIDRPSTTAENTQQYLDLAGQKGNP